MVRRVGTGCVECESATTNVSSLRKFPKKPALQSHSVQCRHARGAVHSHSKRSHSNPVSQSRRVRRHEAPGTAGGRARSAADLNTNLSQAGFTSAVLRRKVVTP